jgi:MFS transporter, NNP family, nitrate/nitrite transporter
MRAFHVSWFGFFMAFFIWFAIAPLLTEIQTTLRLTKKQIWTSSIVSVTGTILMRFILGPLIDKYGARIPFVGVLCLCAIPSACTGFVNSQTGLCFLRFFIGLAGGSFVMCQSWTSRMFSRKIIGSANALAAGWGNLGAGVTQLMMGSVIFPLFKDVFNSAEKSWRFVCVIPAFVTFWVGVFMYYYTDDLPKGNYHELKKHGTIVEISAAKSFRQGAMNINSWLLALQYSCSFGVELTMNSAAALYFKEEFGLSTSDAAAIASIFGFFNLFARATGGWTSDNCNRKLGMQGRLLFLVAVFITTASLVSWFARAKELWLSILVMMLFAFTVQSTSGTIYSIVPYVDPANTGSVSGIVGAGGGVGAVCFGLTFRQLSYRAAFKIMGYAIFGAAVSVALVNIKGCSGLFGGVDKYDRDHSQAKVLDVPEIAIQEPHSVCDDDLDMVKERPQPARDVGFEMAKEESHQPDHGDLTDTRIP